LRTKIVPISRRRAGARYAKGGDNPKLKDWAGKTLPALQHHREMVRAMGKNRK